MSQMLPYEEINFERNVSLKEIINTPDNSLIGYFLKAHLRFPDNIKEKTRIFSFVPEIKVIQKDKFKDFMKKKRPNNYTISKKLKCDWTDKKKYLIH